MTIIMILINIIEEVRIESELSRSAEYRSPAPGLGHLSTTPPASTYRRFKIKMLLEQLPSFTEY